MGTNYSIPKVPADFPYFFTSFRLNDQIKIAPANDFAIDIIRRAALQCWLKGIQTEMTCEDTTYEIQLKGKPFKSSGTRDEALQMKRFCCKMLADLRTSGWILVTSSDLSRSDGHSTLFFQRNSVEIKQTPIVCLSLSWVNCLQLINASGQLKEILKDTCHKSYSLGVAKEKSYDSDYEIRLQSVPWDPSDYETSNCGRKLMLDIVHRFEESGFLFYGKANLKETADCLFFVYNDLPPAANNDYIMVSLNKKDRLRLFDCPKDLIEATRNEIEQHWQRGMQNEINSETVHEFQLNGYPWDPCEYRYANQGKQRWVPDGREVVASRYLILMLLKKYLAMGWSLITSLDISRKDTDKSVFVFKSCQPVFLPNFCICLNGLDKILLISAPKDVVDLIRSAINEGWSQGINEECEIYGSHHQFTLNGQPFGDRIGNEFLVTRVMMVLVLKVLTENGWRILCTADVSSKNRDDVPDDVDSWYFTYAGNPSESFPVTSSKTIFEIVNAPSAPPIQTDSDLLPTYSEVVETT